MIPGTAGGRDSALLIVSHLALSSSLWGSAGRSFGTPPGGYRICLCLGENRGPLCLPPLQHPSPRHTLVPPGSYFGLWGWRGLRVLSTPFSLSRPRAVFPPSPTLGLGAPESRPRRPSSKATVLCRLPAGSFFGLMEYFPAGPREKAGAPRGRCSVQQCLQRS